MTEKEKPELPGREANTLRYDYGRIATEAAVIRNLEALGAVKLSPKRQTGFREENRRG